MSDDLYVGVPFDLRPTKEDAVALMHIIIDVKQAIQIRHDFQDAAAEDDFFTRRLRDPVPTWESDFAKSSFPGAKTKAGLAKEHARLAQDAKKYAESVKGNRKLARLLRENLSSLFPPIGFSKSSGTVKRLVRDDKSALRLFHPLGVGDVRMLIRLLIRRPGELFYW